MKIVCVGRNYAEHARELKNEIPSDPVLFMKPDSAVLRNHSAFYVPDFSNNLQYEAEVVVKISKLGKSISERFAHRYFDELTLGIDFTARDVQEKLKQKGLPWEMAKAFDSSAAIGDFVSVDTIEDYQNIGFSLQKNGVEVQVGNTAQMLFSINKLIAYISKYFTLKLGDLIFTGTPAGVGVVAPNDLLVGFLNDKKVLEIPIK